MSRINEYSRVTELEGNSQCFVVDSASDGTRSITLDYLAHNAVERFTRNNAAFRNNIYRPADLGTVFTEEQNLALSGNSPKFENLYVGSYWTINGHRYTIAHFDYWYNRYDKLDNTASTNDHHVVLIPLWASTDTPSAPMNDTATTEGGYLNSKMYTEYLSSIRQTIEADWGNHILTHRECFTNATTDGYSTGHLWVDSKIDLMNEYMLHGSFIHSASYNSYSHDRVTADLDQLAIFRLYPRAKRSAAYCWLRDIVSPTEFASGSSTGLAAVCTANADRAIRPVFAIKAT